MWESHKGAIACLASWQATLLVGLCALATAGRFRSDRRAILRALPYAVAVIIATAISLGWALWTYESFEVLGDKLTRRTSGEAATIGSMITFQVPWLAQLLGLGHPERLQDPILDKCAVLFPTPLLNQLAE